MKLNISKLISQNISSRQSIKIIKDEIRKAKDKKIVLDFFNVKFISRSFADELLKLINSSRTKGIELINCAKSINEIVEITVENKKTINFRKPKVPNIISLEEAACSF